MPSASLGLAGTTPTSGWSAIASACRCFRVVNREQTFHGSYWGNNTDLSEVLALAAQDKIRHTIKIFTFDQINENLELIRAGDIVGRAVLTF